MIRYVRAFAHGSPFWAIEDEAGLRVLNAAPWRGGIPTGELRRGRLLAPVEPTKIVCIGTNYRDHGAEMGKPVPVRPKIFLKPPSAIVGPGEKIEIPPGTERVDHEAELGIVIARRCSRVPASAAMDYVFGCTAVNDVTARDFQKEDGVFARAKGFDTFCPVGPAVVTGLDVANLRLGCTVFDGDGDGETRQQGVTSDMVFGIPELIAFISAVMTLEPGDLVSTGTPAGVGPIRHGQKVRIRVDGVGDLENPVVDRSDR